MKCNNRWWSFSGGSTLICLPTQETWVRSLGWEDLLEEEMVTHSSILAWEIPLTEETNGLQSLGLWRVKDDWLTDSRSLALSLSLSLFKSQLITVSKQQRQILWLKAHECQDTSNRTSSKTSHYHNKDLIISERCYQAPNGYYCTVMINTWLRLTARFFQHYRVLAVEELTTGSICILHFKCSFRCPLQEWVRILRGTWASEFQTVLHDIYAN